jgi:hypothetical protein
MWDLGIVPDSTIEPARGTSRETRRSRGPRSSSTLKSRRVCRTACLLTTAERVAALAFRDWELAMGCLRPRL